jgi:hypothetical protein
MHELCIGPMCNIHKIKIKIKIKIKNCFKASTIISTIPSPKVIRYPSAYIQNPLVCAQYSIYIGRRIGGVGG